MKKIFLPLLLFIVLISCSEDKKSELFDLKPILGKWQYVETLDYNPPGPYIITDGPIIEFKSDGSFTSNQNVNFPGGTYTVSTDSIISFNFISNIENSINKKKIILNSDNELILDNDYSGSGACTEGCGERYEKRN